MCVCVGGQRAAHTAQCIAEHSGISRRIEGESSKRVLHLWGEVRVVVGAPRARAHVKLSRDELELATTRR